MVDRVPAPRSIRERLEEFYRRLHALPRVTSAMAAYEQLCAALEQVEDELSGVEMQKPPPGPANSDGRMYCPSEDHILRRSDGSLLALTRGHRIEISNSGAVRIINKSTLQIEFEK